MTTHRPSQHETTILLAEDDDGHAALTQMGLRQVGIPNPVIRFRNGQETLDFLRQNLTDVGQTSGRPFLLLLDLWMPKVDGFSVLRQLKLNRCWRRIPVVVLSTTDNPSEIESCFKLQCDEFIVKPVGHALFMEAMNQVKPFLDDQPAAMRVPG